MDTSLMELLEEYERLQNSFSDPSVLGDKEVMKRTGKRLSELEPVVDLLHEYRACKEAMESATTLKDDPELATLARHELEVSEKRMEILERDIHERLKKHDPLDTRNAIVEVRAGTGGDEAALFAAELLRMYLRFAETKKWKAELLDKTDSELGGIKEAIVRVTGQDVYGSLKYEGGVHRVQRIPATENKGRVHTSAASVAVFPEAEKEDVSLRMDDLRIDTFRAGGAGGQHVNKTDSAVRITHIPTGIVVACQSERSQIQNRERAMELLRTKLYARAEEEQSSKEDDLRSRQVRSGDRSDKIRTYNFPQDRLTDHRIDKNFHNLPDIMEGNIGLIIGELQRSNVEMGGSGQEPVRE